MLGRSIGNNDRSFSSPRSREGNELRSLAVEFSVDVVGIIISQLINVHIIISEDAGNGDGARRKGEGEGKRGRERRGEDGSAAASASWPPTPRSASPSIRNY